MRRISNSYILQKVKDHYEKHGFVVTKTTFKIPSNSYPVFELFKAIAQRGEKEIATEPDLKEFLYKHGFNFTITYDENIKLNGEKTFKPNHIITYINEFNL